MRKRKSKFKDIPPEKIPEGIYQMVYVHHEPYWYKPSTAKLAIYFKIVEQGIYFGKIFARHYGMAGIDGNDKAIDKNSGAYVDEILNLIFDDNPKLRRDRYSLKNGLKERLVRCKVRTVKKSMKQIKYADQLQYSVIEMVMD